mmetsp:Transcript_71639/g.221560  ORF Transcript_71639/g.221560 Transcript_71639/m.221560 type:complete len:238 (-) Transcript_71639:1094-1807(-)
MDRRCVHEQVLHRRAERLLPGGGLARRRVQRRRQRPLHIQGWWRQRHPNDALSGSQRKATVAKLLAAKVAALAHAQGRRADAREGLDLLRPKLLDAARQRPRERPCRNNTGTRLRSGEGLQQMDHCRRLQGVVARRHLLSNGSKDCFGSSDVNYGVGTNRVGEGLRRELVQAYQHPRRHRAEELLDLRGQRGQGSPLQQGRRSSLKIVSCPEGLRNCQGSRRDLLRLERLQLSHTQR